VRGGGCGVVPVPPHPAQVPGPTVAPAAPFASVGGGSSAEVSCSTHPDLDRGVAAWRASWAALSTNASERARGHRECARGHAGLL